VRTNGNGRRAHRDASTRPSHRPLGLLVAAVVALTALTACSSGSRGAELPTLSSGGAGGLPAGSATGPAGPSSAPPSTSANGFSDAYSVIEGRIVAPSAEAKAVAAVWMRYWRVRLGAYHDVKVDAAALSAVAVGDAQHDVTGYVAHLAATRTHTVGSVSVGVSKVSLGGNRATVVSCLKNGTIDVDARLNPVEAPTPYYAFTGILARSGSTWRVAKVTADQRSCG
jgi:hypothetical protein